MKRHFKRVDNQIKCKARCIITILLVCLVGVLCFAFFFVPSFGPRIFSYFKRVDNRPKQIRKALFSAVEIPTVGWENPSTRV